MSVDKGRIDHFSTFFYFRRPQLQNYFYSTMVRTKQTSQIKRRKRRVSIKLQPRMFQSLVEQTFKDVYGVTNYGYPRYRIQSRGLSTLQEAAESFLEDMWGQVKDIAVHSGRQNVLARDVMVWKRITDFKLKHIRSDKSLCEMFDSLPIKK